MAAMILKIDDRQQINLKQKKTDPIYFNSRRNSNKKQEKFFICQCSDGLIEGLVGPHSLSGLLSGLIGK